MSSTGQVVGGVVGAVVGFFVGGPSGAYYGAQIGMVAGGLIDPPKVMGPRLDDLTAQTSTYGAFIPRIYGTAPVVGNIFWVQGNKLIEREAESEGKGGPEVTNFDYFASFAVSLCEGPIDGVRRIWIGGQLWYDAGSNDLGTIMASNESFGLFTLYTGSETQNADPLIQADRGAANVPAYRGLAYLVFNELPVKDYGNSLAGAQVKVEVVSSGTVYIPRLISAFSPTEKICYAADGVIQTAIVTTLAWSSGIYVYNTVTFSDYNALTGLLLKRFSVTATLTTTGYSGSVFSSSHVGGGFVVGKYGVAFCGTNIAGNHHIAFSDEPVGDGYLVSDAVIFPRSSGAAEFCFYAGGYSWLGHYGTTKITRISRIESAAGKVIEFNLGHSSNPVAFVNDPATDSTYVRYDSSGTWLMDITGDLNPELPLFNIKLPGTGYISNASSFAVFDGKVCHATAPLHIYDISLGADIQNSTIEAMTYAPVHAIAPGVFHLAGNIYTINSITAGTIPLSSIVQSECLKSDLLAAADIDVIDLTDQVQGYRVSSLAPLRGGIDPLRKAWPFDVIQHGYKIKFKRRGGASVATITSAELDARAAGSDPGVQITNVREMDLVLPNQLTAKYLDSAREYDINVAEESRQ